MRNLLILIGVAALCGCSKSANEVRASYISPVQYQNWSCQQIGAEIQRVSYHANRAAGVQDDKATNDAVATGVALVLFWPAAFLISGGGETAAELARLKGEFEALERAGIEKNCGLNVRRN